MEQEKMTAEEYYRKGNEYRRQGNWQMALNNYLEAIALDPESPAVQAKEMLDDILNFYHKDYYNP
jgi:tetratricopeptide (TPR) repeat protein